MDHRPKASCSRNPDTDSSEPKQKQIKLDSMSETCIANLPHEMVVQIFQFLDIKSVSRCALLCKSFYRAAQDSMTYESILLEPTMSAECLNSYLKRIKRPKALCVKGLEDKLLINFIKELLPTQREYLSTLRFKSCLTDELSEIISLCINTTSLTLQSSNILYPVQLKNLKTLCLLNSFITMPNLINLLQNNVHLTTFSLICSSTFSKDSTVATLVTYSTKIEYIDIRGGVLHNGARSIRALSQCHNLIVLKLDILNYNELEDSLQKLATGCPLLKVLSLNGWKMLNDDNIEPILRCSKHLVSLYVINTSVTHVSFNLAATVLPKLRIMPWMDPHTAEVVRKLQTDV